MPKFIFKANNDVLSHCRCEDGPPAMSTGQLDCPWCGCGWLISCSKCKKSFTYAVVRETDTPLQDLARREHDSRGYTDPISDADVEAWVNGMVEDLAPFAPGQIIVYLDGSYFALDARDIDFEGYYARHKLDQLPHATALNAPSALRQVFGDKQYWLTREREDRY